MPSFDFISEVDKHELQNAVDQANKELVNRFDFKGVKTKIELSDGDKELLLAAPTDFQLKQLSDIVEGKMIKRGIGLQSLDYKDVETNVAEARQKIIIKQGIDQKSAKKITSAIKDAKLKVQTQIQGDKIRVTGKKRDDLQEAIALIMDGDFDVALDYDNFRD
tara:strand:+ start:28635 stop:29123 length:489 start_codon:yes stop_codon:yes gene_type:complete